MEKSLRIMIIILGTILILTMLFSMVFCGIDPGNSNFEKITKDFFLSRSVPLWKQLTLLALSLMNIISTVILIMLFLIDIFIMERASNKFIKENFPEGDLRL